jgi:hypothetical protein
VGSSPTRPTSSFTHLDLGFVDRFVDIEDKRPRERAARRAETGKRSDLAARLVEAQRVMGWREALNELDTTYPGRLR